jgi:hypothetical protein
MKRYLATLVATALLVMACCVAANVIWDPYRILHPAVGTFSFPPNDRIGKAAFLSTHCRQYRGYFMGDSRSEILSGNDLGNAGDRYYNYSVPRDEVEAIVRRVDFLARQGCPLTTIVVGESIDVLMDQTDANLLLAESPLITRRSRAQLFAKFLFNSRTLIAYARAAWAHGTPHYVFYADGHVEYLLSARSAEELTKPSCGSGLPTIMSKESMLRKLSAYRTLGELAARNHFKLVVWIAPLNHWYGKLFDEPIARQFIGQLRALPDLSVVEASRESPLLSDYTAWHDCIHFRTAVFDQLVAPSLTKALQGG